MTGSRLEGVDCFQEAAVFFLLSSHLQAGDGVCPNRLLCHHKDQLPSLVQIAFSSLPSFPIYTDTREGQSGDRAPPPTLVSSHGKDGRRRFAPGLARKTRGTYSIYSGGWPTV